MKIPILMYHSIEAMPKSTVMRSLHVSPQRFENQMRLLNFMGFKGVSMRDLTPYLEGKKTGKVVGITFDDGYQNNLINAAPILKKYSFGATCYIVSKRIGLSNIWDLEKGISQRPLMNILEIKEWLSLGFDIGAHSQTHNLLEDLNEHESQKEIFDCKADLEEMFKIKIWDYCYPFGRFNAQHVSMIKAAGYKTATTMRRGKASIKSSNLTLPRIPITHHTLPHLFILKLLTKYEDRR